MSRHWRYCRKQFPVRARHVSTLAAYSVYMQEKTGHEKLRTIVIDDRARRLGGEGRRMTLVVLGAADLWLGSTVGLLRALILAGRADATAPESSSPVAAAHRATP